MAHGCEKHKKTTGCDDPHHDHDHQPHVKTVPAPKRASVGAWWAEVTGNIEKRFVRGVDPTHVVVDEHGHEKPFEFKTAHKTGAILGAMASLGLVVHGGMNIMHGINGYEDSLGEKHEASALTVGVGATEAASGLLGMLRALSGRWFG